MNGIEQIVYRAPGGGNGVIQQTATSLPDNAASERWMRRLEPWLRAGNPLGRCYLDSGSQAALIRWQSSPASRHDWESALVLVGPSNVLTSGYALEVPELSAPPGGPLFPVTMLAPDPGHAAIVEGRARSKEAIELLVPLLARVLAGERSITMPWTGPWLPDAVMWGLVSILAMLGDTRPVSFLSYAPARAASTPGLFVSFRPGAACLPPDPGFETVAITLAIRFADGPAELRRMLQQHGMLEPTDHAGRITRLLDLWPHAEAANAYSGGTQTVIANSDGPPVTATAPPVTAAVVICPICLHDIEDWAALPYWRWDTAQAEYVPLPVPAELNQQQRNRLMSGAYVRCPEPHGDMRSDHYLPVNYGRFGHPVLLGFIGLTQSGKTHLLAAMIGAIEAGALQDYGIFSRPVDNVLHERLVENWVHPLYAHDKELPGTREGIVTFADAFLIRQGDGPERLVALFDVAGGDLARPDDTKHFLEIANGLFFVIDPEDMHDRRLGDVTFKNVLNLVADRGRSDQVSAAIVLNKADKVRFDEPVARWLRCEAAVLDPAEFLLESADVYAYLHQQDAAALGGPYQACGRATLHVASPAGGSSEAGVYPRGVQPRRVLRPLVAMLAMTGVLTGPAAEKVGI